MSNPISNPRPDDPAGVMKHAGRYNGGRAMIILGGYSGAAWEDLKARVRPDVILAANGTNGSLPAGLVDYWMCSENLSVWADRASKGDQRGRDMMAMLYRDMGSTVRLISHRSWHLVRDFSHAISIRRHGYELADIPADFSFRVYGEGYLGGWVIKQQAVGSPVRVGTVALHLLHHAGILGCSEIHTIGLDLMFRGDRDNGRHHWYPHPEYKPDKFRRPSMFTEYKGISTQWWWLETADYLKAIYWMFERDQIRWIDHSEGLLKIKGVAQEV